MTLRRWLTREKKKAAGMNAAALARKLGVSEAAVSRWVHEECPPRLGYAVAIERISGGAVTVKDLLRVRAESRRGRAA